MYYSTFLLLVAPPPADLYTLYLDADGGVLLFVGSCVADAEHADGSTGHPTRDTAPGTTCRHDHERRVGRWMAQETCCSGRWSKTRKFLVCGSPNSKKISLARLLLPVPTARIIVNMLRAFKAGMAARTRATQATQTSGSTYSVWVSVSWLRRWCVSWSLPQDTSGYTKIHQDTQDRDARIQVGQSVSHKMHSGYVGTRVF